MSKQKKMNNDNTDKMVENWQSLANTRKIFQSEK